MRNYTYVICYSTKVAEYVSIGAVPIERQVAINSMAEYEMMVAWLWEYLRERQPNCTKPVITNIISLDDDMGAIAAMHAMMVSFNESVLGLVRIVESMYGFQKGLAESLTIIASVLLGRKI